MVTWEIKKIIKSKNGIIALILFLILSISMVFINPQLASEINNNGEVSLTAEEQFNNKIQQLKEVGNGEGKDEFSKELKEMANEKLAAIKFNGYKDVEFWQVFNYRTAHPFMIFIMLIIITMFFSNIYTDEIISDMDSLILSSRNKNKVLYSKLAISIIFPVVLYVGYLVTQIIITYIQYGKPINGNLQAIRILDIPLLVKNPYTIYEFILLKIGILLILLITLSVLASLISFITKNSIQSISGFLIFIFLGKVMTLIKFLPNKLLLILSKINYIDLTFNFNKFALMYSGGIKLFSLNLDITNLSVAILIGTLFIEILLCKIIFKKFLTR
ncbi:hypothetical protein KQH90_02810 [Anaerosalibacter bizertensis]|uniref:hypothetical protein n=1 Tax=Anaerosalibacter bizertensis TaxID=932217 RepID=UPI001C0F3727|nr:hypothetical protein [Anaerosalibacter bizertensis]MBU5292964.1 hypothetical protein [Anaerosalibacter bizertensis]